MKMGHDEFDRVIILNGAGHYFKAPVLTTTQRDALTGVEGMVIFNSTTDQLEEYDGATWEAIGQVIMSTHEADLDAHTRNLWEKYSITPRYATTPYIVGLGLTSAVVTADQLWVMPFPVIRPITLDRIAIEIQTAHADKNARLGIYEDGVNHYPAALVAGSEKEISTASTGLIAGTIDISLTKGLYWLALVTDSGTMKTFYSASANANLIGAATLLQRHYVAWKVAHSYAALPDPFTAGGAVDNYAWQVGVRIASLD